MLLVVCCLLTIACCSLFVDCCLLLYGCCVLLVSSCLIGGFCFLVFGVWCCGVLVFRDLFLVFGV